MTIENLISTMDNDCQLLYHKMNIENDAIIINQTNYCRYNNMVINGCNLKTISLPEKGVGLSRNTALIRSSADIIVFSDDDMLYLKNYNNIIKNAYKKYPSADVIIFNIHDNSGSRYVIKEPMKISWYNFMRFGCVRITCKRQSIIKKRISFSTQFGGGSQYGSGEDTIFLHDCLKNGLSIIAVPSYIAELTDERKSTWFEGYNEKFFYDKGALFEALDSKFSFFYIFQFALRRHTANFSMIYALKFMLLGKRGYKICEKVPYE